MNRSPDISADINVEGIAYEGTESQQRGGDAGEPVAEDGNSSQGFAMPQIEGEVSDVIHVGAGGPLIVPREEIDGDIDIGEDLDLAAMQSKKIRKPHRREFISLNMTSELPVKLLLHKPKADGIETEYYYVHPSLRAPIIGELKQCRVFVYYSWATKTHALWIVHVTPENSWYESLHALFKLGPKFFEQHAVRVMADKENSVYAVKKKPAPGAIVWPTKSTGELLGESLSADKIINVADHPLYRDLTDGDLI